MTEGQSAVEVVKAASRGLRGQLAAELTNGEPGFSHESYQLLKFHGIYQQDDRTVRAERTRRGLGPDYICMVRISLPGGALTGAQYLAIDELCDAVGNGTLRVTTRQGLQLHFVRKDRLHDLIARLNATLVTTLGACGDVVRNTTCCPAPLPGRHQPELAAYAAAVARRFRPRTKAYYELWLDGEPAATVEPAPLPWDEEPLYGDVYLPRKFKVGFAAPDDNCVDVHGNDVGVVPVIEDGELAAFTLLVGGSMGRNHNNPNTFARLATPLTTVAPDDLLDVIEAVARVQRAHGDRVDREHARLKYLVHEWGTERVRAAVAAEWGRPLDPARPVRFAAAEDHLGWHRQEDGRWFLGVKTDSGRLADRDDVRLRSAIRSVIEDHGTDVRFTAREDLLLTGIDEDARAGIDACMRAHGVRALGGWAPVERHSFACPALPTCGLALAESERVLPDVLSAVHAELAELGLANLDLHVRMTGCPNGCARPYTAEVGIVGRGKGRYDVHLGGDPVGTRLNTVFCENVPLASLAEVLRPVLTEFRDRRAPGEPFGAYCQRAGVADLRARLGTEQWVRRRRPVAVAAGA